MTKLIRSLGGGLLALGLIMTSSLSAQSLLSDANAGRSMADHVFGQVALRWQANDAFRLGFEVEGASFRDRFLAARLVHDGAVWTFSVPMNMRILARGRLRADGYLRGGYRVLQSPFGVTAAQYDQSQAITFAPGLIVSYQTIPRLWVQTGLMVPFTYEFDPEPLWEQQQSYQILAGLSYRLHDRIILLAQSPFGPSYGGDGDTAKFLWTLSGGLRFVFGETSGSHMLLDPAH